ncbi:MAG: hypothetical protein ACM357_04655 [Gemmatimonadota bacterium]
MQASAGQERNRDIPYDDWFVVYTGDCSWLVSTEMARHLERALDARRPPRWVTFVDLAGARVRILSGAIYCIEQSTAHQREAWRQFQKARRAEDRGWHRE